MKKISETDFGKCPYVTTQKIIQGKWAIIILHFLEEKTLRFNELKKLIPDITHSTLTSQLRYLEDDGLIQRTIYPEVTPRVEYSLTDIGKSFKPVLDAINVWGNEYINFLISMYSI